MWFDWRGEPPRLWTCWRLLCTEGDWGRVSTGKVQEKELLHPILANDCQVHGDRGYRITTSFDASV